MGGGRSWVWQSKVMAINCETGRDSPESLDELILEGAPEERSNGSGEYVSGKEKFTYNEDKTQLSLTSLAAFEELKPNESAVITIKELQERILNNSCIPINTLVVATTGLPLCGKTNIMFQMISNVLLKTSHQESELGDKPNDRLLSAFNLCLLGGYPFHDFRWIRTSKRYSLTYFTLCDIIRSGILKNNNPLYFSFEPISTSQVLFGAALHDEHINWLFGQITKVYSDIKDRKLQVGYFQTGASIINAVDVSVNKALYDFLPIMASLCPKLARLNFFSLDRDVDNMSCPPDLNSKKYDDLHTSQVLHWRSRLTYLLHHAAAGYSPNSRRDQTTIMVGVTESLDDDAAQEKVEKARKIIMKEAKILGIEKVFSNEWLCINAKKPKSLVEGRKKLEQLLLRNPQFQVSIPLKWFFLHSLIASVKENDKVPITMKRQKILKFAEKLDMNDQEVENFLITFTEFASILYSDKFHGTVILDIRRFTELLDKLYYPSDTCGLAAKYGIITESYAEELLDGCANETLEILMSCGLVTKLNCTQVSFPDELSIKNKKEILYFLPSSRISSIINGILVDSMSIVINSIHIPVNSQASIALFVLQTLPNVTLVANETFNITRFRLHDEASSTVIEVDVVYLGGTTELRICNSDVTLLQSQPSINLCSSLLKACCNALSQADYDRGLRFNIGLPCCSHDKKDQFHFFVKNKEIKFCDACKLENIENKKRYCWFEAAKQASSKGELSSEALHHHHKTKLDPKFAYDVVLALINDPDKYMKKIKFIEALDIKDPTALLGLEDGWQYYMMSILLWEKEGSHERSKEDLRTICNELKLKIPSV